MSNFVKGLVGLILVPFLLILAPLWLMWFMGRLTYSMVANDDFADGLEDIF